MTKIDIKCGDYPFLRNTETVLSSLTHSFICDFRAKKNNATDTAIMLIMLVGSAVGIDISEENANEYITTCKKFGTRMIDATELEQRLDEIINREE